MRGGGGNNSYNEHTFRTAFENLLNSLKPHSDIKIIHEPKAKGQGSIRPDFKVTRQARSQSYDKARNNPQQDNLYQNNPQNDTQSNPQDSLQGTTQIKAQNKAQGYESLLGFIECKNYGTDLSPLISGKQIEKYLTVCHNIILTDYNRFILLSYGNVVDDITLFDTLDLAPQKSQEAPKSPKSNQTKAQNQAKLIEIATRFSHLLNSFFDTLVSIKAKDELIKVLSTQSFYLSSVIDEARQSHPAFGQTFENAFDAFRNLENTAVSAIEFCDILSQSIVYGMFVAHIDSEDFEIDKIPTQSFSHLLPKHFATLTEFILHSLPPIDLPRSILYTLENIIKTIALIDKSSLATSFQKEISEISIYLYEDFLKAYDNLRGEQKRKEGGVFYTPEPIVEMITRSINELLGRHFDKSFSDDGVKVLDFATGTGSFLAKVFEIILDNQSEVFTKETIINKCFRDIYGFEISFVPYIVAHLKLSAILKNRGFSDFSTTQKFQIFLTNTLDLDRARDTNHLLVPFMHLKNEREKSLQLKHKEDLLVILGNPPYNVKSKNKGAEILELLQSYKQGLNETKINLDDDYIKFIRFAQWKLTEQNNKRGVMGFITNNSYLDGRTHRKMRESLAKSFDEIYILNLHGDSREDENVFDIRVGVCISLFVRHSDDLSLRASKASVAIHKKEIDCHESANADSRNDETTVIASEAKQSIYSPSQNCKILAEGELGGGYAKIHYFSTKDNDILRRNDKFALLNDIAHNGLDSIKWQMLNIQSPYFWFVPKDFSNAEYENFWALATNKSLGESKAIFENYGSGNKAERYQVIHFNKNNITKMVDDFIKLDTERIREKYNFGKDSRDWGVERAKADILANVDCHESANADSRNDKSPVIASEAKQSIETKITQIAYRPFDIRYTFFTGKSKGFWGTPSSLSKHFLQGENLGICFPKDCEQAEFDNAIISDKPVDIHYNGGQTYIAPLYCFVDSEIGKVQKIPNFTKEFSEFAHKHKVLKNKSPEQILAFIYGNLYNPSYRAKYIEYLKIGFPRINFGVADFEVSQAKFEAFANLGQRLIDLHLMRTIPQDSTIELRFRAGADKSNPNFVLDKTKFDSEKILLNSDLEIVRVSAEVWDYTIGGYKVLDKWLKYRVGLKLEKEDFTHLVNIAKILKATIAIQKQLTTI